MENLKEKLHKLREERKILLPIAEVSFKSKQEGKKYIENNYQKLQRLNEIEEQIRKLEYELMTPEEQKRYDKGMEFLRLKAKGEPFDLTEFEDI